MKRSKFATVIQGAAVCTGILALLFSFLYFYLAYPAFLTLAITVGTTCYHFAMRLAVGALVPKCFDYRARWFRPLKFEATLYKKLRLRCWKDRMPTYDPALFSIRHNSLEQIINNTCQAEVVHEIIILCSFVPLLFSAFWDSFAVFLVTSVLAAGFDLLFVMMQRYNRPRIIKLLKLRKRKISHA